MPLLYYWTRDNYVRNMDSRDWFHLNQGSPLLREVAEGESLWAFTRNSRGTFVLAAELVVTAKGLNSPAWTERYGPFREELRDDALPTSASRRSPTDPQTSSRLGGFARPARGVAPIDSSRGRWSVRRCLSRAKPPSRQEVGVSQAIAVTQRWAGCPAQMPTVWTWVTSGAELSSWRLCGFARPVRMSALMGSTSRR
jgi:hypothetical protein